MDVLEASSSAWKVFSVVATTRVFGHVIEAGHTTNRRVAPAKDRPVIWVVKMKRIEKLCRPSAIM